MLGSQKLKKTKKTIAADGSLITLQDRSQFNVQSLNHVAHAIINNVKKRKFRTVLTKMGWLNAVLQPIAPDLVERLLIYSENRIKQRSL